MELSGTGVSVTSICPGPIVSNFDRLLLGENLESVRKAAMAVGYVSS